MPKKKQPAKKAKQNANQQKRQSNGPRSRALVSSLRVAAPAAQTKVRGSYFTISDASSRKYSEAIRIRGQDFLASIPGNSLLTGANVYNLLINPQTGELASTRLAKFSELYDKFLFLNLRFHYEPVCPTSTVGGIVLAYDRDPSDATPPASDHGLHSYYAMMGARSGPVWSSISIDCPLSDTQDFYYGNQVGGDERLYAQGQVYIAATSTLPAGDIGSLWVEYECMLFDPQLEDNDTVITASTPVGNATNTTKQGFNGLVADSNIGTAFSIKTDDQGNTFLDFPREGAYEILTHATNTGASTGLTLQPFVNGILDASRRNTFDSFAGTSPHNLSIINVPRQGLQLYSQWTTAFTGGTGKIDLWATQVPPETFVGFT
jgi:hypothetical protein